MPKMVRLKAVCPVCLGRQVEMAQSRAGPFPIPCQHCNGQGVIEIEHDPEKVQRYGGEKA